jgi:hypothetical protein
MNEHGMHHEWPRMSPIGRWLRIVGLAALGVIGAAVFALAFGWLVMILWNWLMPAVFGLGLITYWQAFGITILARLVFGRIGGPHHVGPRNNPWRKVAWDGPHGRRREDWRHYREFWETEGRDAFERFVQKKNEPPSAEKGE